MGGADIAHHLHPFTDYRALATEGGRPDHSIGPTASISTTWPAGGSSTPWPACGASISATPGGTDRGGDRKMRRLPYYNAFFKTATVRRSSCPPGWWRRPRRAPTTSSTLLGLGGERHSCVRMVRHFWEPQGPLPQERRSSAVNTAITARPWRRVASPAWGRCTARPTCRCRLRSTSGRPTGARRRRHGQGVFGSRAPNAVENGSWSWGPKRAAFVAEPIQRCRRRDHPAGELLPRIRRSPALRRAAGGRRGICGFGRMGHWFGSDRYGSSPTCAMANGITSGYLPLSRRLMGGERVATS